MSGLRRLCLTPQRVAPDPHPDDRALAPVVSFKEKAPDVDEDVRVDVDDDDNHSSRDNITNALSHQLAKSLNRAVAKMVKQEYNRVAKQLFPDRNIRKGHH